MTDQGFDIEKFILLIEENWPNMRNSEKALAGIKSAYRHLIDKELRELWIFLKEKGADIKSPSASQFKKLTKEHSFRVRESEINQIESRFRCGQCGQLNGILERTCISCGKNFSDLPKKCSCGYVFPKDSGYCRCQNDKCRLYRIPGEVVRVMV